MGLRLKINLVVAPLVAIVVALAVWADYRHESVMVMDSHAMHTATVGSVVVTQPVDPALLPDVVASRSLQAHVVFGALLLMLVIVAINGTLHVFVFGPLTRLRERLLRMERGHWRDPVDRAATKDELGQFAQSFELLGPEIDALVGQSLHAERLAVLALLARQLDSQLQPELRRVACVAVTLNGYQDEATRDAGAELARSAAAMFAIVGGLDHAFAGDRRAGPAR